MRWRRTGLKYAGPLVYVHVCVLCAYSEAQNYRQHEKVVRHQPTVHDTIAQLQSQPHLVSCIGICWAELLV